MWHFHVDDLQGNRRYNMIIRRDILSELKIDLRFSKNKIQVNGGACEVYTAPMKDVSKINFNASYNCSQVEIFQNE